MKKWKRYELDEALKNISNDIKETLELSNLTYEQAYLVISDVNSELQKQQRQMKLEN